jgi:hypothetical protein
MVLSLDDCGWKLSAMMEENTKIPETLAFFSVQTIC